MPAFLRVAACATAIALAHAVGRARPVGRILDLESQLRFCKGSSLTSKYISRKGRKVNSQRLQMTEREDNLCEPLILGVLPLLAIRHVEKENSGTQLPIVNDTE